MKKTFKFLSPLIVTAVLFTVAGAVNVLAESQSPNYTVHINTPVVAVNPLSISGTASATNYVGQESAQHVVINWGDGSTNTDLSVPIGAFSNGNFSWSWGPVQHTYNNTVTESFKIIVNVCHQNCTGAEGSGDSTDTQIVVIPPQGNLIVKKVVVGGTTEAGSFSFSVNGGPTTPFTQVDATHGENHIVVNTGTYSITEPAVAGYSTAYDNCTDVLVPLDGNVTCTITNTFKINPTLSITNSPQTYDGTSKSATVVVVGSVAGTVSDVKYGVSSIPPTNAGTYAVTADFAPTDTTLYNSLSDASAGNFVINKADTTTTVTCADVIYTGAPQTPCTASVTGAGGLSLPLTPVYSNNTDAGTATASYTYSGNTNYNGSSDSTDFNIAKADPTCDITGFSGTYDANSHGATGSCTGVLGETLAGLDLGSSFTDVPGGTANWTFTDETGNYNNDSGSVDITLSARDITVTADAKGKNFGASDPALTYTITFGSLVGADSFSGDLDRDSGEDVGTYTINKGSLSLGSNYNLSYESGIFTISTNTINVTADHKSKVYGNPDPELTYNFSPALEEGDNFSGSLSRSLGEDVGIYGISQGDLSLSSNYNLSFTGNTLDITPASITVTADAQTKVFGTVDPVLTYQITSGALVGSDTLSGALTRALGEDVGAYAILQGTLDNSNYDISYVSDDLTITKADQIITFDPLSDKVMGDPDFDVNATASSGLSVTFDATGTCTISGNTIHITAVGDCTVTAHQSGNDNYNAAPDVPQSFTIATLLHTITASAGSNGAISPSGGVSVSDGSDQAFTMIPNSGFHILDVVVDGSSISPVGTYTFTNVVTDHTITVSFEANERNPECSDDSDNDEDGQTDYPADPGCDSPEDDSESPDPSSNGGGGGGGGSSGSRPRGQVLGATTTELCTWDVNTYMRKGYRNNSSQVVILQRDLLNGYMNSGLVVDGLFGPLTEAAVKSFQVAKKDKVLTPWGLTLPTGIFYKTTLVEAKNTICSDVILPIPTDLIPWSKNPGQVPPPLASVISATN